MDRRWYDQLTERILTKTMDLEVSHTLGRGKSKAIGTIEHGQSLRMYQSTCLEN